MEGGKAQDKSRDKGGQGGGGRTGNRKVVRRDGINEEGAAWKKPKRRNNT